MPTPSVSVMPLATTTTARNPQSSPTGQTPSTTPPRVPTQSPIACLLQDGKVELHEIQHPAFVAPIRLRAYLPPCYEQDSFATYPTIVLLHGLLGTDAQWDELGVNEVADRLIHTRESPPFIILLPWIRNSQDPRTAVMEAVIPYAKEQWRLAGERQFWAIGGISRGAGQALQIGLLHPEQFAAIGLHSPAVLHAPELLLSWYLDIDPDQRPELWFDIGESDSLLESALRLVEIFRDAGAPIEPRLSPGEHSVDYWAEHLPAYMTWYRSSWLPDESRGH